MQESWYDVAQICLNGHLINHSTKRFPQRNKNFAINVVHLQLQTAQNVMVKYKGNIIYQVSLVVVIRFQHFARIVGNHILGRKPRLKLLVISPKS